MSRIQKQGAEPDYQQYRKAAEHGNAEAQFHVGVCYENGQGVEQNYGEAAQWYRKAAEQGYAEAQCSLGLFYMNDQGVPQDDRQAALWFRKAAEQGYAEAQFNLGVSSCGGYTIVPNAVTYCAAKFYVSAFTEGLAWELKTAHAKLRAKVFAPAATKTEFGKVANGVSVYDYDKQFSLYHTSAQTATFLLELYDSDKTVGLVDRENFSFHLYEPQFQYAGNSQRNQKM